MVEIFFGVLFTLWGFITIYEKSWETGYKYRRDIIPVVGKDAVYMGIFLVILGLVLVIHAIYVKRKKK
jgi:hypothetical protein